MFEFNIFLDDNDYLLFNQYHLLNSPSGKKSLMSFRLIIPFLCFMVLVIFCIAGSDFELILIEAIMMTVFSILWIGYSKKIILKSMNNRVIQMKKEGRLPYSNEAILKFDNEKIHEITPNTENVIKYSLIEKVAITEKAIYIYFSSVQAYILPVTAFSEEMEKLKFLEFIKEKGELAHSI
ncbi:YcxB family protein [Lacrimispora indolis]|uniref:YcxB family protein n=1 Tax=Lacrimispora indolis TaxID=69825 RepID=UPI0003F52132|nr:MULTISPECIES: YcxB family protein [Lachnospiraceae]